MGLEENELHPGRVAEPGAMARKAVVRAILDSSADNAGGEEQTWVCEVDSCTWRSRHQSDTTKKVEPQENDVRHFIVVTTGIFYSVTDPRNRHRDCRRRCRHHFCRSVTAALAS